MLMPVMVCQGVRVCEFVSKHMMISVQCRKLNEMMWKATFRQHCWFSINFDLTLSQGEWKMIAWACCGSNNKLSLTTNKQTSHTTFLSYSIERYSSLDIMLTCMLFFLCFIVAPHRIMYDAFKFWLTIFFSVHNSHGKNGINNEQTK